MLDIRLVVALLLGLYGLVLTILGIGFTTDEEVARSAGVNINLWAGLGMLLVAIAFLVWARLRPLAVPPPDDEDGTAPPD